jgi:hypothetical protein
MYFKVSQLAILGNLKNITDLCKLYSFLGNVQKQSNAGIRVIQT